MHLSLAGGSTAFCTRVTKNHASKYEMKPMRNSYEFKGQYAWFMFSFALGMPRLTLTNPGNVSDKFESVGPCLENHK